MIDVCYNPECSKELHYLTEGRIVRIVHSQGDEERLEHFWLCGPRSEAFEFVFEADDSVSLKRRHDTRSDTSAA